MQLPCAASAAKTHLQDALFYTGFYPFVAEVFYFKEIATSMFTNRQAYVTFLKDYKEHKAMLDKIKHELADK